MVKIAFVVLVLGLFLVGSVSAYICISPSQDNEAVKEFKQKINTLALEKDIRDHNLTEEAFYTKLKYFSPCR